MCLLIIDLVKETAGNTPHTHFLLVLFYLHFFSVLSGSCFFHLLNYYPLSLPPRTHFNILLNGVNFQSNKCPTALLISFLYLTMQFLIEHHHCAHNWHKQHKRSNNRGGLRRSVAVHRHGGHSSTGELTAPPTHRQRWMWTGILLSCIPCELLQLQEQTLSGRNSIWISGLP